MQKLFTKEFRPGEKWSGLIGKNKYIHFKALGDNANVSILLYNMRDTSERYNMPDTLKAQYTAHLIFTDAAKKTSRLNLSATIWVKEILYHA